MGRSSESLPPAGAEIAAVAEPQAQNGRQMLRLPLHWARPILNVAVLREASLPTSSRDNETAVFWERLTVIYV